ncbi:MAG: lysylphosphatidylglycerol synthase transmembrane domain-containing protein [Gemmatimonadales bacterium]
MSRRAWRPLVGLGVAAVFAWLLARSVDWRAVRSALASAVAGPLAVGIVLLAGGFAARIARWWWMLRPLAPSLTIVGCVRPFLASLALNNTLPFRAGDVARAVAFRDDLGVPAGQVLGTLLIERVLDLVVLLGLLGLGLATVAPDVVPRALVIGAAAAGALGVLGLTGAALMPASLIARLRRRLGGGRLATVAGHAADAFATLRSPARVLQLLALSALAWTLEGGMYASVALSLGAGVSPLAPWLALATGTLSTLLPGTPGYVGTFDYFAALGLAAGGAAAPLAAAFVLLVHALLWVPVTAVGGLLLLVPARGGRLRWRRRAEAV